jgi:hypothetical protein
VSVSREQKIYRKGDLPMAKNMKFEGKTTGELEAVFPDTKDMTKEDVKGLLNELASYGFVRELVEQTAMDSRHIKDFD